MVSTWCSTRKLLKPLAKGNESKSIRQERYISPAKAPTMPVSWRSRCRKAVGNSYPAMKDSNVSSNLKGSRRRGQKCRRPLKEQMPMTNRSRSVNATPCGEAKNWQDLTETKQIPSRTMKIRSPWRIRRSCGGRIRGGWTLPRQRLLGETRAIHLSGALGPPHRVLIGHKKDDKVFEQMLTDPPSHGQGKQDSNVCSPTEPGRKEHLIG